MESKERTEEAIQSDLQTARQEYQEASDTETMPVLAAKSAKVKALQRELSEFITDGAEPCEVCGNPPHGIHQPKHYEVGCLTCPDRRAIGMTRQNAVDNWNAGEFIKK